MNPFGDTFPSSTQEWHPATLFADGRLLSNGRVLLEESSSCLFQPTDVPTLDHIPYQQAKLTLRAKSEELQFANFRRSPGVQAVYLFEVVRQS